MRVVDVERLFDYSYWANRKLFAVISQLTGEQFVQQVGGSYGSVRNTLVHVLSAEWGWLERCGGPARGERLVPERYPTADLLVEEWDRVEVMMRGYLARLSDEEAASVVEFKIGSGATQALTRTEMLVHAAVHAAHHRGQVSLLLRMLGYTPGNFDVLIYDTTRQTAGKSLS
jgi:uncharacterized damage-inducible protein DinB